MTAEIATVPETPSYFEQLLNGDLSDLSVEQRTDYYLERCRAIGLDPLSQPFLFMQTRAKDGEKSKTILYTTRSATDQIAKRDGLSGSIVSRDLANNLAIVVVRITAADGKRTIDNIGAASFKFDSQAGDALKRSATQAYRRGIIQFAGVGAVSEEDIEDIAGAQKLGLMDVTVAPAGGRHTNRQTGEITEPRQLHAAPPSQLMEPPEITAAHVALYTRLAATLDGLGQATRPLDEWEEPGAIAEYMADMIAHVLGTMTPLPAANERNRVAIEEWRDYYAGLGLHTPELAPDLGKAGARWLYDTYAAVDATLKDEEARP